MATGTPPHPNDAAAVDTVDAGTSPPKPPVSPLVPLLDLDTEGGVCDVNGVCS